MRIVNVITRHSADTQGVAATLSSGTEDHLLTAVRYGGTLGTRTWRASLSIAIRPESRSSSIRTPVVAAAAVNECPDPIG